MSNQPLNLDAEVSKDQTIFVYETADRDYPQHGSIMLKLHHNNFQSSLMQISKRTAESLRDQLNELLAVAQPVVNSVEELDKLPVGTLVRLGESRFYKLAHEEYPWVRPHGSERFASAYLANYAVEVVSRPAVNDA